MNTPLLHLNDWRIEIDKEKIAWIIFDKENEKMNTLGSRPIKELDKITSLCADLSAQGDIIGVVFLSAKKNNFIAGADIREFKDVETSEEAFKLITQVNQLFERIEKLPVPVVAAIHGFCLGGGLELAQACHYRIADREDGTRIGFPEVKLGIIPGFNGSARALYRGGALGAMPPMLAGKQLKPSAAKRAGYVDQLVPTKHTLRWAARKAVLQKRKPKKLSVMQRLTLWGPVRGYIASQMTKKTAAKISKEHYPAPFDLIELYRKYGGDIEAMKKAESDYFAPLMASQQSRNLRRVFFLSEAMKKQAGEYRKGAPFKPVRVHVIGAGVMGADIAAWCVFSGMEVTLQDMTTDLIENGRKRVEKELFKKRYRKSHEVKAAMNRLIPDPEGKGRHYADIIIEAVVEKLEVKQQIFEELEKIARPEAVLATNTSSIPLEKICENMRNPDRLIGVHFFNPVAKMPLVEIIQGRSSRAEIVGKGCDFVTAIRKYPIVVKSAPGFLVNRVLAPYMMEAITRLDQGVSGENLDQAAKDFGMPMGPIELADTVGLDVMASVAETLGFANQPGSRFAALIEAKKVGKKVGEGFYKWEKGKPQKGQSDLKKADLQKLADELISPMLRECQRCLNEGIVANEDLVDGGVIFGTGFAPFRGGPLHYLEETMHEIVDETPDEATAEATNEAA